MRVAILMGGTSPEAEVSRKTGKAVAEGLRQKGHYVEMFEWEEERVISDVETLRPFDVVFVGYHGGDGENGRVQAALELAGLKFTGSGYVASALGMNKILSKIVFAHHGIPTPAGIFADSEQSPQEILAAAQKQNLRLPLVIKPAAQGSTVGVTIANSEEEFFAGIHKALEYGDRIIVEKYIPGREVTVSILGGLPLPVVEIIPKDGFYDYEHKYTKGKSEYICPAEIEPEVAENLKKTAVMAYRALGCRHYARVDFRLSPKNEIFCLEVNTLPGMTELSLVPMAAKSVGIEFPELVDKIVTMAYEGRDE